MNNNICNNFLKDNIIGNVYDNFIDRFKYMCVCVCVCVCDDFLKGNIYTTLCIKVLLEKF